MLTLLLGFAILWMGVSSDLISRGKAAVHSSLYPVNNWIANRTVDGNYNSDMAKGSCHHSNYDPSPNVVVDLNGRFTITHVVLYNRQDCCSERMIGVTVELLSHAGKVVHICGKIDKNSNIYEIPCANKEAHKVRVRGQPSKYLQICELEVHGEPALSLISRGKPNSCSSIYGDMDGSLALDGNYTNYINKNEMFDLRHCFMSNEEELPHFSVDLQGIFKIDRVELFNRVDCCGDRMIGAIVQLLFKDGSFSHECGRITEDMPSYNISCGNNVAERVRVVGAPKKNLQLCEVDVYGKTHSLPSIISRNKPTTESSFIETLNSSLAVDGKYNNFVLKQGDTSLKNCFNSDEEEDPFMEVDLQGKYSVDSVVIHNRMDCCSDRMIGSVIELLFQNGSVSHKCGKIKNTHSIYKISCKNKKAHKVRVRALVNENLQICELDVYGESAISIISRGKPVTSSSIYEGMEGAYAVDGRYEYDVSNMNDVNLCHTNNDEAPFMEVDLQGKFVVDHVIVYNRLECCQSRLVDATIELMTETGEVGHECGKIPDINVVHKIPCGGKVANKVRLKGPSNEYLHFAEFDVFGEAE